MKKISFWSFQLQKTLHKSFKSDKSIAAREKLKISVLAIFAGLVVAGFFILWLGKNPFLIFYNLFTGAFLSKPQIHNVLQFTGCFIVAGLAVAFAFKVGLFNIGVSGQMLVAGSITMVIGIKYQWSWVALLLLAMVLGALAAGIAGVLKAFFKVHEVVSTLLLNWIWFFIYQYITNTSQTYMRPTGNSVNLSGAALVEGTFNQTTIILVCSLLVALATFFIFAKTVLGFQLKVVGANPSVAKCSGYKVRSQIIIAMIASGLLAGLLGFLVYFLRDQGLKHFKTTRLPSIGFDGIAITLLAFNNPVGIILVAFFWAILNVGSQYVAVVNNINSHIVQMIIGIIVYFAAIATMFQKLKPLHWFFNLWLNLRDLELKKHRQKYQQLKKSEIQSFLHQKEILKKKTLNTSELQKYEKILKLKILKMQELYKLKVKKLVQKKLPRQTYQNQKTQLFLENLKGLKQEKEKFEKAKKQLHFYDLVELKSKHQFQIQLLKKEYKVQKLNLINQRNVHNLIGLYQKYRTHFMLGATNLEIIKSDIWAEKRKLWKKIGHKPRDWKKIYAKINFSNHKWKKEIKSFHQKTKLLKKNFYKSIWQTKRGGNL